MVGGLVEETERVEEKAQSECVDVMMLKSTSLLW